MSGKVKIVIGVVVVFVFILAVIAITQPEPEDEVVIGQAERLSAIPESATKMTPDDDLFKPIVHSDLWEQPVPMAGPVNTAGAEDSPYITSNGLWFFFFFTPDVEVPPEKQLIDGVTGIWWAKWDGGNWTSPRKIVLNDDVSLDGAQCVVGTTMWFASVRAGNYGEIDVFTAEYEGGRWTDVENAGTQLNVEYDIGEFHLMPDGLTMYFHTGSQSYGENMDLWKTEKTSSGWSTPVPLSEINTDGVEGYPFVTPDGSELWFTSTSKLGYTGPAIFRSVKQLDGTWGEPEEVISNFAGESTMDAEGNIYFVHHYYSSEGEMIEADIYVAYKR
jgi:hypothetical protein